MKTISLQKYAPVITMNNVKVVNRDILEGLKSNESFAIDFKGIEGIEMAAANELLNPLRKKYGARYRQDVTFLNVEPLVGNAFVFSGSTKSRVVANSSRRRSFISRMFFMLLMVLTLGVGQMWADCQITNLNFANFYNTVTNSQYALTNDDNNHFYGSLYVKKNVKYECKFVLGKTGDGDWSNWYRKDQDDRYTWEGNWGPALTCLRTGGDNDYFHVPNSGNTYKKLYIDIWGEYTDGWTGPRIKFYYEDVADLSASLSADATSVQGGSTTTVRGGCSGGSGSYGYSYTVICGGSDVTATVLSGSGENRTFTAPMASTSKTYRVTITATEQNSQLTGLGFTGSNSKYVDITVPGITAPTVTLTVDKINVNQITLTGTITAYNGYGSNASDLNEVGFYIGATKYTATYKSGSTFTKTITGLTANTAYANVKAFSTNPLATGNSSTTTVTTLADATYRVKVRVDHGDPAPHIYAWRDADDYGGSGAANAASFAEAPSMTLLFAATTYDWYYYDVHNEYEKFIFYKTGSSDQTADFAATRTDDCFWYDESKGTKEARAAKMTCPVFETQLVVKTGEDETQTDMTGSGTVTLSKSLTAGTHQIKVMYNTEYYGKNSSSIARTGSTSSNSISGMVVEGAYITLTADFAGTYTFSFNTSTKTLSVTYPAAYQVTYSKSIVGTDNESISAPSASYNAGATSVTSGTTWIPSGTSVTFAANDATSGYTWKGWYSVANPSADYSQNLLSESQSYARTVSATATIYAVYAEDMHTVTVQTDGHGTITTPASGSPRAVSAGIASSASIAASPNSNYVFYNWTKESGSGIVTFASASSASTTVKATSTATVQANFVDVWNIKGDQWSDWGAYQPLTATGNANEFSTTLSLTKGQKYKFKIVKRNDNNSGNDTWYGNANNAGEKALGRGASAFTTSTGGGENDNITVTPDVTGDYTFTINTSSTPTITVTYPTAYVVTYSAVTIGSGTGHSAAPSAEATGSIAVTSTDYVSSGKDVTFTAEAANTGYTFQGWFDTNNPTIGTTVPLSSDDDEDDNRFTYTAKSISGAVTVYAIYTEDLYTVTVTADEHGTITTPAAPATTVTAGVATKPTITAEAVYGYYFKNWTVEEGSAEFTNASAISTTVSASSDATIKANFVSHWTIAGGNSADPDGEDAMGDWSTLANSIEHFEEITTGVWQGYVDIVLPANTTFYFKVRDLYNGSAWYGNTGEMTYGDHTDWLMTIGSSNCRITTAGAGTYRFTWNETTLHLTVTYPDSYTVTYGKVADNGQDIGGVTATGDDGDALTTGKYVAKGSATFTAAEAANYTFVEWRTSSTYGEGTQLSTDNPYTMTSIGENKTVYANYAENMTTVNLAATNGKIQYWDGDSWEDAPSSKSVGVITTCSIKAVPNTGYYFAGWKNTEGTDYSITGAYDSESNNNTTLSGNGAGAASGQTLTANFVELEKIYFRNIFDDGEGNVSRWSDVYVYYDITWDVKKVHTNSNSSYIAHMSPIAGKDVYWAYVPRAFTVSNNKNVAFSDTEFTTNYDFYNVTESGSKAAARGDYNKALNMFVPNHTAKETNINGVDYFDNGYWMKYDTKASQGAGYYLKKFKSQNNYWQMGEFVATADDATAIRITIRVDNTGTDSTRFMIVSAGALNYLAESAISAVDYTKNVYENLTDISKQSIYFQMNTDTEGDFTFILDQSGDVMKLTVDYPVSPGDYRLKHTYTGRNKANSADSTYITYSDVIKSNVAESGKTLSMYLNNGGTETLVLQKCTEISTVTKDPVWSEGYNDNLSGILAKVEEGGNSVYQFDITVNTTSHKVSEATNIKKYDGPFYIKTDCADGGWINYNQNKMGHNTINFDPEVATTFDYYFCKWIDNTSTNVKCVIANDYCNQISDTLKSDAILNRGGIHETLPYASNVRFSYNSSTNELKRSYLLGSTDANSFLYIVPSANGLIYAMDGTTDLNTLTIDNANRKFKDNGNWTYQMDVKIYPSACGGVYSNYPTVAPITTQHFLETTNVLMGGSYSTTTLYHVRLIYDYKTNNLVAAWMPGGEESETIDLQADFMMIRNGQEDVSQLSFSGSAHVDNAQRAYGAFQFNYDDMVGNMSSWDATSYALCMYYFSFPFDVNVSDIFGVGTMGVDWRIQKYNGAKRAEKGWFAGDGVSTFWEDVTAGETLHAYEGYSLLLNRINFNDAENSVWTNISAGGSIYLIFPSASTTIGTIAHGTKTVSVPEHVCTINRYFEQDKDKPLAQQRNHRYVDSNWNMVGAPLFQNLKATGLTEGAKIIEDSAAIQYVYTWNSADNTLSARATLNNEFKFNAMTAYMVQYAGTVTFEGSAINPSAAPRRTPSKKHYKLELELTKGETFASRAYVELRENAVDSFLLNEDMYMMRSSKTADIYTFAGGYDVAANVLSIGDHIIPVGVNVKTAGAYTFSMPNEFSGTITLIDTYTQERTNLSLNDYEVTLQKGEINDRFYIEINIQEVITSLENVDGNNALNDNNAHKFIQNDQMYILKNGVVYDARGARVK